MQKGQLFNLSCPVFYLKYFFQTECSDYIIPMLRILRNQCIASLISIFSFPFRCFTNNTNGTQTKNKIPI